MRVSLLSLSFALLACLLFTNAHCIQVSIQKQPQWPNLSQKESIEYIHDRTNANIFTRVFRWFRYPNNRSEVRLNLGADFRKYILDASFRRTVNAFVNNPATQIWSDVKELDLSNSNLTKIPVLAGLTNLEKLNLRKNHALVDIDGLAGLSKLKELDVSYTGLTKIPVLTGLTSLEKLDLSSNTNLIDITGLNELTTLKNLNLSFNNLTKIPVLTGLTKLGKLDLSFNQNLDDITGLDKLTALAGLDIRFTKVNENDSVLASLRTEYVHIRIGKISQ